MVEFSDLGLEIFEDRYSAYPGETWNDATERVSSIIKDSHTRMVFEEYMTAGKIIPAGRILRSVGSPHNLTGYNCYVLPSPKDSRQGIVHTLSEMIEIMSHGGGVGINLATLRPTGAKVYGVDGKSSGPVSWGEIYSFATGLIEQGGSRRGALMLTLPIWHPSVLEFIRIKKTPGKMENANLSVLITDAFMDAVRFNEDWTFTYPDTTSPLYDETWDGDLDTYPGVLLTYDSIPARKLWYEIAESAWASAEPGVIFWDTVNSTFAGKTGEVKPVCVNPCSEQPLPAYGVCNLAHINLSEFVLDNGSFDMVDFMDAVQSTVVFLDTVIDYTNPVLQEVQAQQSLERRIGVGVLGLHDTLIKMGIEYGSSESFEFVRDLFKHMYGTALEASTILAEEYGAYPNFDYDDFIGSSYQYRELIESKNWNFLEEAVLKYGVRNASLLTVAPTGTVGTMFDVSTGIEPHFSFEYERTSRLGTYKVRPKIAKGANLNNSLYVTAYNLSPQKHLLMLTYAQEWVDSSISKTINLPANYTVDDVAELYYEAWRRGAKGLTIYRDGSRSEQILTDTSNPKVCENCGGELVFQEGCVTCKSCGFSYCTV